MCSAARARSSSTAACRARRSRRPRTRRSRRCSAPFPGIEIVGWYTSNYELGAEQAGVASLLAANPADRRHPDRRLRHRRHPGAQGRRPAARADRHVRLQRLGDRMRHRDRAGPEVLHLHAPALSVGGCDQARRRRARRQSAGHQAGRERLSAPDHRHRRGRLLPRRRVREARNRQECLPGPAAGPGAARRARPGSTSPRRRRAASAK